MTADLAIATGDVFVSVENRTRYEAVCVTADHVFFRVSIRQGYDDSWYTTNEESRPYSMTHVGWLLEDRRWVRSA